MLSSVESYTNRNQAPVLSKTTVICLLIALAMLLVLVICQLLVSILNPNETGLMRVCVYDGETNAPIANASIYIPETGDEFFTNEQGQTAILELPVLKDPHYDALHEQPYGVITLIVRAEGYLPYCLFYAHILPDTLRQGPNVWLFPGEGIPFSVIEGPDEDWVREFLKEVEG